MYYSNLIIAFIVGQLFFTAICSFYLQKNLPNVDYWTAFKIFLKKEFGGLVVAISFVLMLLFVLPDFINLQMTREELLKKENLTKVEQAQIWFKTIATAFGIFAQWIPFIVFKRGKKAIEDYAKQKGIETEFTPGKP